MQQFVTVTIASQMFGIPVLQIQDILAPQQTTRIPLAPKEVAGGLNLRGRIVTAIDIRNRLDLPPREKGDSSMNIVVEHGGELYSLIVDQVGEVLSLPEGQFEKDPTTMDAIWHDVSNGIYRLPDRLMLVLDVAKILTFDSPRRSS
ncbi:MAG: chemotaxis protein CheW [Alphaproteobacteria bacterium GWF2_58_20]|nr:MAG: chemotaxis protein CheW [Alphaproteobacteria bacterium GWF2_58_20]